MRQATGESIRGRATGSLFFTGFGSLWSVTGLQGMHRLRPASAASVAAAGVALLLGALLLWRRAGQIPAGHVNPAETARLERVFNAVNIIQWVAVATAVVVLSLLHLEVYIVPAIAIIVGLHLYPLAEAFHYTMHYVTGTALIAWSVGCIALLEPARIRGVGALGTGFILLLSSAVTLLLAFSRLRSAPGRQLAPQI